MTQEALLWMLSVQLLVTFATFYFFYKVLKKGSK